MRVSPKADANLRPGGNVNNIAPQRNAFVVAVYLHSPRRYCAYIPPSFTFHHSVTELPISDTHTNKTVPFLPVSLDPAMSRLSNYLPLNGHGATDIIHLKVFSPPSSSELDLIPRPKPHRLYLQCHPSPSLILPLLSPLNTQLSPHLQVTHTVPPGRQSEQR